MTEFNTMADRRPGTSTPPLHLVITAGHMVNIQRVGETGRVCAEVLGAVPETYIALRGAYSSSDRRALRFLSLRAEDPLILRFVHEGVVYGFRTAVSRLVTDPEHLVFVHYPRCVEHVSVRREPRLTCRMPCLVTAKGDAAQPGLLLDVSPAGCRVVIQLDPNEDIPPEGFLMAITLALPDRAEPFHVDGEVRRLAGAEEGRALGIAFNHEQRSLYDALERYLRLAPKH